MQNFSHLNLKTIVFLFTHKEESLSLSLVNKLNILTRETPRVLFRISQSQKEEEEDTNAR